MTAKEIPQQLKMEDRLRQWCLDLKNMINECPFCGGSGLNYDVKQAWDISSAPTPECEYCEPLRDALEKLEALIKEVTPAIKPLPSPRSVAREFGWNCGE